MNLINKKTLNSIFFSTKNKFLFQKKSGMSLVEIIVAIGISVITMTSAAVFSNSLLVRSQQNFSEVSALQLQNMISEELRILEMAMKKDLKRSEVDVDTGGYLSSAIWTQLCSENLSDNNIYLKLTFPDFANTNVQRVNLSRIQNNEISFVPLDGDAKGYQFYTFQGVNRFGAFDLANSPVNISIKKEIDTSLGSEDNLKTIKFTTFVSYNVLGIRKFTKPADIKMVYSLVCLKD